MAREVICPKDARTRILHILSDSIPQSVRFTAEPVGAEPVGAEPVGAEPALAGLIEIERGGSVIGRKAEQAPLVARNEFRKSLFDSRYAVFVTPGQDTRIVFQSRHFTSRLLFIALGIVLVLGVIAGLGGLVIRWLG
jgi:hypothetical protein